MWTNVNRSFLTLREVYIQCECDIYAALLIYRFSSVWFKAFIYFREHIMGNEMYFNSQFPPWEIGIISNIPRMDISSEPSRFPKGFKTYQEVEELKFYLKQWWCELKLMIDHLGES